MNYLGIEVEMYPVSSSNVIEVGYEISSETILVRYTNNTVYAYKGVNENEFDNLKTAPSIGSYIARNFKNVYPYERVE